MQRLVECIPNFSEGRDASTLRALVTAVHCISGVFLLGKEMDVDHHRAVLTLAGEPYAVAEAAFQCTRVAMERIDLRRHRGGHPRVGATDVIPFVPLGDMSMETCITLARQVGERIGHELDIPVFLYAQAASTPERGNLETIRRGGLPELASRIETDGSWNPDYGPGRLHPTAGATVVGARPPLIAYNVNLSTLDLGIAKSIAKAVRSSSGGLPFVKAIGIELPSRGLVQVSMNLTNFEKTSMHTAFEAVQREAVKRGVQIAGSEIVGLVPEKALLGTDVSALKLAGFDGSQILENRIKTIMEQHAHPAKRPETETASILDQSVSSFLNALSAGTPMPGGGSVAALAGTMGTSLGIMVCGFRKKESELPAEVTGSDAQLHNIRARLVELRSELASLVQQDVDAYADVLEAYRLPKTDASRSHAISERFIPATLVPIKTAELAQEVGSLLQLLHPMIKPSVLSDLRVGLFMAVAAIEGGLENARTNVKHIESQSLKKEIADRIASVEQCLVELKSLC